jgi:hypothetical protein
MNNKETYLVMIIKTLSYIISIVVLCLIFNLSDKWLTKHYFLSAVIAVVVIAFIKAFRSAFTLCARFDMSFYSRIERSPSMQRFIDKEASLTDKFSLFINDFLISCIRPKALFISAIIVITSRIIVLKFM